jgi:hypothetical protein
MHPDLTHMISAERSREMRQQAADWRRAREARSTARVRPVRIPLAARLARVASSLPGRKQLQDPATA